MDIPGKATDNPWTGFHPPEWFREAVRTAVRPDEALWDLQIEHWRLRNAILSEKLAILKIKREALAKRENPWLTGPTPRPQSQS